MELPVELPGFAPRSGHVWEVTETAAFHISLALFTSAAQLHENLFVSTRYCVMQSSAYQKT